MAERVGRREGDWFAVPLGVGGYAVGLVARAPERGRTLFGYFFGPAREKIPSGSEIVGYSPGDAVCVCRFYDEPLVSGRWPIIISATNWTRSDWPMPEFHIPDSWSLAGHSTAVQYSEDNPDRYLGHREIGLDEEAHYPPDDGVFPASHLEYRMAELLGAPHRRDGARERPVPVKQGVTHWLLIPPAAIEEARRQLALGGFDDIVVLEERENGLVDVLVTQEGDVDVLRSLVDGVEAELTTIATSLGGQYDGTEWALP